MTVNKVLSFDQFKDMINSGKLSITSIIDRSETYTYYKCVVPGTIRTLIVGVLN